MLQGRKLRHLPVWLQRKLIGWTQDVLAHRIQEQTCDAAKRRANEELSGFEFRNQVARIKSHPRRIYFEVTRKCNLSCRMCQHSFERLDTRDIDIGLLDAIKPILPYNEDIALLGCGESLTTPVFFEVLRQLPTGLSTRLISNGILMDEDACEQLVKNKLSICSISIDATDEDIYERIRGKRKFSQVIRNIETLVRIKQRHNSKLPFLCLSFVAMRSNIDQLPEFVCMAKRLGAEFVAVGYLNVFREELREESLLYDREHSNQVIEQAREIATELGLGMELPKPFNLDVDPFNREPTSEFLPCSEPWEFVYISNDGTVKPCCIDNRPMGNLHEKSFEEIWNDEPYRRFRRAVNTSRRSGICLQCVDFRYRDVDDPRHHFLTKLAQE